MAASRFRVSCPERPNDFLVCVTEINTREQIDALVEGLAADGTSVIRRVEHNLRVLNL